MKGKLNKNAVITACILVILGLLGVLLCDARIAENLACSLLASGIVLFLTTVLADRQAVNPLEPWGIRNIYTTRGQMNADCDSANRSARHQLDIVAFGLKTFRQECEVDSLLKRGVQIRIITMDPDSPFVSHREQEEGKAPGSIRSSIEDLVSWADSLNRQKSYKGSIEIRGYSSMTLDFYWRVDDELFVGPYWYDYDSQQTVSYRYKGGDGFKLYTLYFEKLWCNAALLRKLTK